MVGKNTRREPDAPLPLVTDRDRRWAVFSKGELRRMLFTPSDSWYGFPELYEGNGEAGFENFWLEDLVGEAVEDDGVAGMAEGGQGSYAFLKVLLTVGEAAASERERPVVERPKVLGSEVV